MKIRRRPFVVTLALGGALAFGACDGSTTPDSWQTENPPPPDIDAPGDLEPETEVTTDAEVAPDDGYLSIDNPPPPDVKPDIPDILPDLEALPDLEPEAGAETEIGPDVTTDAEVGPDDAAVIPDNPPPPETEVDG